MNKFILLIPLFFSLISCSQIGRLPASFPDNKQTRHVVFDIDWTITSEVSSSSKGQRIIEVEGKKYFIHDGLEDFMEYLLSQKNIAISFFSGGSKSRNHKLLKKIKLKDGRSLEDIAYKILNSDDLTVNIEAQATDNFSKRYKKDLRKISSDLDNLIMIDDTEHFVLDKFQEDHVLVTGNRLKHFESFNDAIVATGDHVPRTYNEWSFNRNRLYVIKGAFQKAIEDSNLNGSNFSESIKAQEQRLDLSSGEWNAYSKKMLKISLDSFESRGCLELITPFL